jgi:ribonuclease III
MTNGIPDPNLESSQELVERLKLPIVKYWQLTKALTHRSYLNENPEVMEDNERLEYLGDAALGFVVADWLYNRFPDMTEGDMTRLRSALVQNDTLGDFAMEIDLGKAIRLGKGESANGGRKRRILLGSTFEALIGAISLESGIDAVKEFMAQFLESASKVILKNESDRDYKSRLQEVVQADGTELPEYKVVGESGPDHDKEYTMDVYVGKAPIGRGAGKSKQEASKAAAKEALKNWNLR